MNIANTIDHTLLKPDASQLAITLLCNDARSHGFAAVCINPFWVSHAARELTGTDVAVCTVVGFPLGSNTAQAKAFEATQAIQDGATEIDMVLNIGALKSKAFETVEMDIRAVVSACKGQALVKVILETCLLTDAEKVNACQIATTAGANFMKTSTGFSTGGATLEDVRLMAEAVGGRAKVKASGGIRDKETALAMIDAGASRLGTSSGVAIIS